MQATLWNGHTYEYPLSDRDTQEILKSMRGLVTHMALKMTHDNTSIKVQDLAQEGWLAMWKAINNWDGTGTLDGWMKRNAKWRMLGIVMRRNETELPIDSDAQSVWDSLVATDDFGPMLDNYHSDEVQAALVVLTPTQREFVVRKFWMGQNKEEITSAMQSVNPYSLWAGKYGARNRLHNALKHLAGV